MGRHAHSDHTFLQGLFPFSRNKTFSNQGKTSCLPAPPPRALYLDLTEYCWTQARAIHERLNGK